MKRAVQVKSINTSEIEWQVPGFDRFVLSKPIESAPLQESIARVGLIQPVGLRSSGRGWQIIYGARRVWACLKLGFREIPARIWSEQELPDVAALEVSLAEDVSHRAFNPMEKATILSKFQQIAAWDEQRMAKELCPRIDLPGSMELIRNYLGLCNLSEASQLMLINGELTPAHAFLLLPLKETDQRVLAQKVFSGCAANLSEAKEIVEVLQDLRVIQKQNIEQLLDEPEMREILESGSLKPREKCRALRLALKRRRFPSLLATEQKFGTVLGELGLPNHIRVQPPPFFEENYLQIQFRVSDETRLQEVLSKLQNADEAGLFHKLFKTIRGLP